MHVAKFQMVIGPYLSFRVRESPENEELLGGFRIEGVTKPITGEVESESRNKEEQPGEDHHPPRCGEDRRSLRQHATPRGGGRRYTHAEERERGLEQDVRWDDQRRVNDDRRDDVGKDLARHDPQIRSTLRSCGLDEFLLT